jgi:hypothetical protein
MSRRAAPGASTCGPYPGCLSRLRWPSLARDDAPAEMAEDRAPGTARPLGDDELGACVREVAGSLPPLTEAAA